MARKCIRQADAEWSVDESHQPTLVMSLQDTPQAKVRITLENPQHAALDANLLGDLSSDLIGDFSSDLIGDLSSDLVGNLSSDFAGDLEIALSDEFPDDLTDLDEAVSAVLSPRHDEGADSAHPAGTSYSAEHSAAMADQEAEARVDFSSVCHADSSEWAEASFDPIRIYLAEIGFSPLLSADEEVYYARLARQGNLLGRMRMIESNLRLVVKISRRYLSRGLPLLDLIEEGNLGLMHAVEKFDPERGFRFSTYATCWIRQSIERALMNQTRTIRLPIHIIKEINSYLRAARQLAQKLDHEPSAEEIAQELGKTVGDVKRMLGLNERIASVDIPISRDDDRSLVEAIADENCQDPSCLIHEEAIYSHIDVWLNELTEKERAVIERRFSLRGHNKATLEDVGNDIGVTRERVRQIQIDALKKLRAIIERSGFTGDMILE